MHGVKLLGLMLGYFQHFHGENAKFVLFELFDDVANRVSANGIGFDDREGALKGHKLDCWSLLVGGAKRQ
jgi:hypothetical protein